MNPESRVKERVNSLPDTVLDCERCGGNQTMQIRRSSLNEQFKADDIGLKCSRCRFYATHGVPFEDEKTFDEERLARGRRVLDFTREDGRPTEQRLEALGYLAEADSL